MEVTPWLSIGLAVLVALIVRADARVVGPYFAFYELVPGLGLTEAIFRGEERPLRLAVLRRFGYGFLLGLVLAYGLDASFLDSTLAGGAIGVLLVWPITFHGFPAWVAPPRTLVMLYLSVVITFAAMGALGYLFVVIVAERDLLRWIQVDGLRFVGSLVVAAFGLTGLGLAGRAKR